LCSSNNNIRCNNNKCNCKNSKGINLGGIMARKNFKVTGGLDIDLSTIPTLIIQETITSNSATTVDTIALNSFLSAEYTVTLTQGSKIRTSKVLLQTDGTNVDMTEFGIVETGGTMTGVAVSATTASTSAVLQITVTDAASTLVRYKLVRNLTTLIGYAPDAPTSVVATDIVDAASVSFVAPIDNGNSTITSYIVTASNGNTASGSSSPISVPIIIAGEYTFTVRAINANGISVASAASNSVSITITPKAGYFAGGYSSLPNVLTTVDKFVFSNDSRTTLATGLSSTRLGLSGFANSGVAGYTAGGQGGTTPMDKFAFTNDSRTSLATNLSVARDRPPSFANSGVAGYSGGGTTSSTVDKFAFPTDSRTTLSDELSGTNLGTGFANSGVAGYVAQSGTVNKFNFSNDSRTTIADQLSSGKSRSTACANSGTAGYVAGGRSGSTRFDTIEKLNFSNDSASALSAVLSTGSDDFAGMANSGTAGYFGGGASTDSISGYLSRVDKLAFSNDSRTTLATGLSGQRTALGAFANSGIL